MKLKLYYLIFIPYYIILTFVKSEEGIYNLLMTPPLKAIVLIQNQFALIISYKNIILIIYFGKEFHILIFMLIGIKNNSSYDYSICVYDSNRKHYSLAGTRYIEN